MLMQNYFTEVPTYPAHLFRADLFFPYLLSATLLKGVV
jgi:hypothetical protein